MYLIWSGVNHGFILWWVLLFTTEAPVTEYKKETELLCILCGDSIYDFEYGNIKTWDWLWGLPYNNLEDAIATYSFIKDTPNWQWLRQDFSIQCSFSFLLAKYSYLYVNNESLLFSRISSGYRCSALATLSNVVWSLYFSGSYPSVDKKYP